MRTSARPIDHRIDKEVRLAGGYGPYAAKQDPEALLRRSVMACLLWEDNFYEDGVSNTENIRKLIPQVDPQVVFDIAVEARTKQKLRHVPLLIAREMARLDTHKHLVGKLLPQIIRRADELAEFLAIYWKERRQPLSKQVKKGLAEAFHNFNEYQFAKYDRDYEIKLRDVMFLVRPKPRSQEEAELFKKIATRTLATPDTWEVALSSGADKKETWERLIKERKLGALAFMRNLRNMEQVKVDPKVIKLGFDTINPQWLLPLNYFAAAQYAPNWTREIEELMLKGFAQAPKLPGYTIFIVDVSGSMRAGVSSKSKFSRLDAASAMALIASETCERISIYATAGDDLKRLHRTEKLRPYRGFALCEEIRGALRRLGCGGIFTRQCLEFIKEQERVTPDRIIVFSDSQDCDYPDRRIPKPCRIPKPFGTKNYIIDVSSHSRGINYKGLWTAEISGWSEHFLDYIFAYEGLEVAEQN